MYVGGLTKKCFVILIFNEDLLLICFVTACIEVVLRNVYIACQLLLIVL